jgi:hypothetical protein
MNTLKDAVIDFFEEQKWHFEVQDDISVVATRIGSKLGNWSMLVVAVEEPAGLILSLFPVYAPPARRAECAALLHRLNFSMRFGGFDLDLDDGEIRFRSPITRGADGFTLEGVKEAISYNLKTMEGQFETIMRVLYGKESAKAALKKHASEEAPSEARFQWN